VCEQGQLPPRGTGGKYDLFRGATRAKRRDEEERPPRKLAGQVSKYTLVHVPTHHVAYCHLSHLSICIHIYFEVCV
jgi:hypothetical protein